MSLHLPLARGILNHLVSVRSSVDPVDLLLSGRDALGEGVSQEDRDVIETVSAILITPRGAIALADPAVPATPNARAIPGLRATAPRLANSATPGAVTGVSGEPLHLYRASRFEARGLIDEGAHVFLIGANSTGEAILALVLDEEQGAPGTWVPARRCAHLLHGDDPALALAALALAAWHDQSRFCQSCGARLTPILGGWASQCPQCGRQEYPRQDPAIIVAIMDEDERLLLAHNASWKRPLASLIAGFVEAGETPERAVHREVDEEVHLRIDDPVYRATQPWPFPRSQMMGFSARLSPSSPRIPQPDGLEIDWARFYSREEFAAELRCGEIEAPGSTSIAHALVREWFSGALPSGPSVPGTR